MKKREIMVFLSDSEKECNEVKSIIKREFKKEINNVSVRKFEDNIGNEDFMVIVEVNRTSDPDTEERVENFVSWKLNPQKPF